MTMKSCTLCGITTKWAAIINLKPTLTPKSFIKPSNLQSRRAKKMCFWCFKLCVISKWTKCLIFVENVRICLVAKRFDWNDLFELIASEGSTLYIKSVVMPEGNWVDFTEFSASTMNYYSLWHFLWEKKLCSKQTRSGKVGFWPTLSQSV